MAQEMSRRCVPYTPVTKPLKELTIALVSTAGVHLKEQEPFNKEGDETYRLIPPDADYSSLTITHGAPEDHYDRTEALQDMNVIFPLQLLHRLAGEGVIGALSDKHITLMGYAQKLKRFNEETAPAVAKEIERSKADAVLLTAG